MRGKVYENRLAIVTRSSVILNWLRQHGKHQVQYMIGHKHIDSTERYQVQEMASLKRALGKHHPFTGGYPHFAGNRF